MCFMNEKPYRCRTKDYFWLQEMRLAINTVVNDEIEISKLKDLSDSENFFSAASKARAKETANGIIAQDRLSHDKKTGQRFV